MSYRASDSVTSQALVPRCRDTRSLDPCLDAAQRASGSLTHGMKEVSAGFIGFVADYFFSGTPTAQT